MKNKLVVLALLGGLTLTSCQKNTNKSDSNPLQNYTTLSDKESPEKWDSLTSEAKKKTEYSGEHYGFEKW